MINAGDLRERVTFWRPNVSRNDYGEQVTAWEKVYMCRARVQFRSGRRALGEGEAWNPTSISVTARYAPSLGHGAMTTQSGQLLTTGEFWAKAPVLMAAGLRMDWRSQSYHVDALNIDEAGGSASLVCSAIELSPAVTDNG